MLHCVLDNFLAKSIDYFRIEKNTNRNTSSSSITNNSATFSHKDSEFDHNSLVNLANKSKTSTATATATDCDSNTSDFHFDELNSLIDHNNNYINQTNKTNSVRIQQDSKTKDLLTSISLFNELDWFHSQENKEYLQLEENQIQASEQAKDICDYENYESYLDSFFSINNHLNTSNNKNNQCEAKSFKSSKHNFKLYLTNEKEMSSQETVTDLTDDFLFAHESNSISKSKSIKPVLVYEKDYYRDNKLNDDDSDIVPSWRIKDRVSECIHLFLSY